MTNIKRKSVLAGVATITIAATVAAQWADYFSPTPIISPLSSTCWGAAQVGKRDQSNGLEDKTLANWVYWDGGIIKDDQGVYHMFASRWNQADGHNGWMSDSHCVHATSNNLYGPYTDQGLCFTDNSGLCHNVNALKLRTGDTSSKQYAITCSGSVPGSGRVYGADSLNGPWAYIGNLQLDLNGYSGQYSSGDNFRTILRPDGKYLCMNSRIGLADNVLGPYKAQMANHFVNSVPGSPTSNMEDPSIFYAGGRYHVIYHNWQTGKAYFYTSQDGLKNWTLDSGIAYDPATNMVRYTDGTVNHWPLLERSSVYIENDHVIAMTFAAINVQKADDKGNDANGSKVIVVPFDGAGFDGGGGSGNGGSGGANTTGSGGATSSGGTAATGGAKPTSGATAIGGVQSSGGNASGGSNVTGGVRSTGGAPGAGGTTNSGVSGGAVSTPTGGGPGAGGSLTQAGSVAVTGGAVGVGGTQANVTRAPGGASNIGGTRAVATIHAGADAGVASVGEASNSGACGCRLGGARTRSSAVAVLGALGILMLRSRRRGAPRAATNPRSMGNPR